MGKPAPACYNGVVDILQQLERAIDGCCPCGAEPREGSAYCSEDCTPTHRSVHTTDETAMRWRPDMVTEVDDSDLTLIAEIPRSPRLHAQFYARTGTLDVHLRLHDGYRFVGVDVPAEQAGELSVTPAGRPELEAFWQRLERELTDSRRLDPDPGHASGDPWADVMRRPVRHDTPEPRRRRVELAPWQRMCLHCGERSVALPGMRPGLMRFDVTAFGSDEPVSQMSDYESCDLCGNCRRAFPGPSLEVAQFDHYDGTTEFQMRIGDRKAGWRVTQEFLTRVRYPDDVIRRRLERLEVELQADYARANPDRPDVIEWGEAYRARATEANAAALRTMAASMPAVISAFRSMGEAIGSAVNRLRELQPLIAPEQKPEPEHPLARMAARRRDVAHGPRTPQRPQRHINIGRR
uniref:hypothetical protein n=1 Tax=Paractinoplanes polyasparticus TaxID=2856853 RepID=UPI001C8573E9|nr:hypothetical protein [Actinoplanes polyasparticus]